MGTFFHAALTQPLLNLLVFLHNLIPVNDIGWAIIALTVIVRLLLYPSFRKQIKFQREMQKMQPKLNEIKEKHKDDRDAQAKATMQFYKENKINPLSSCFPMVIQLIILIPLYRVFLSSLNGADIAGDLYGFISAPGAINTVFLGIIDLSKRSFVLAILAGAFQLIQSRMMMGKGTQSGDKTTAMLNKQMVYMFPVLTVFISLSLPAGLALYWVVSTLFSIAQQYYIMRGTDSIPPAEPKLSGNGG